MHSVETNIKSFLYLEKTATFQWYNILKHHVYCHEESVIFSAFGCRGPGFVLLCFFQGRAEISLKTTLSAHSADICTSYRLCEVAH